MRTPFFFIYSERNSDHYLNIDDISIVNVRDKIATVHFKNGGQAVLNADNSAALQKLLGIFAQLGEDPAREGGK